LQAAVQLQPCVVQVSASSSSQSVGVPEQLWEPQEQSGYPPWQSVCELMSEQGSGVPVQAVLDQEHE